MNRLSLALWANAVMLGGILIVLIGRNNSSVPNILPSAAAEQPAIAGGAGVFIATGQLSSNTFGCYLMDVDRQTICAYRYTPGDHKLNLEAARNFRYDLQLKDHNTFPAVGEVQRMVEDQENRGHMNNPNDGAAGAGGPASGPVRSDGVATPP